MARRKLLPALYNLYAQELLPALFQVVGFSRRDLSQKAYREFVGEACRAAGAANAKTLADFLQYFTYQTGVFESAEGYNQLAKSLGQQDKQWKTCANKLFYLAVPPQFYKTIFQHLVDSGLTEPCSPAEGWTRVIVEKPFGKDLATAQELDEMLGSLFREEQIFRIDHYLGKETARNILAFRFSNVFLEPAWNNRSIKSIHINFPERQGIENRGIFYDGVGALRDVGQNHMLQLLALFMMNKPTSFTAQDIRASRTRVLEALETPDDDDIIRNTIRAQYKGYKKTRGVAASSQTETYFRIKTGVNLPQWHGVPVYLESGKALKESKFEVSVHFRHDTPCLCPPGQHYTNELLYRIQPNEGVFMTFWVKKPGTDMVIEKKDFSFDYRQAYAQTEFVDAYAKLLLDAIAGDQTLFVSTEEINASWRFIDPIIRAWQANKVPLQTYPRGTGSEQLKAKAQQGVDANKQIGYVGLGKMGLNMVARLREYGWQVAATDPNKEARARAKKAGAVVRTDLKKLVQGLPTPRLVWLMVPHQAVQEVTDELAGLLETGDTVIDGGNSFYKNSVKISKALAKQGINFLDVGVSGGPSGARHGACLMIGGSQAVYKQNVGLFSDLAVAGGYDYMGQAGAGHFIKMVHNGIEYGMMQAVAEGFSVIHGWSNDLNLEKIASLYNHGSVIESRLIGWLKEAYDKYGADLSNVDGRVAQSGEGQWTIEAAQELGIPVPIIEGALKFRVASQKKPSYTGQILSALRNQFGGHDVSAKLKTKKEK